MRKNFKIGFLTVLVMVFMMGTAWAGTTGVHSGAADTPFAAALETLGTARNVTMTGVGSPAANNAGVITYTLTQNLTTGNLLTVTFPDGLAFPGATQYLVCASNAGAADSGGNIGAGTPGVGATTYNFQIDNTGITTPNVSAGDTIWLTTGAGCNAAATNNAILQVTTNAASAGNKLINIGTYTAGNVIVDPVDDAAAVTVGSEFTGVVTTRDMVIDYLGTDATDGTLFDNTAGDAAGMNNFASNTIGLALTTAAEDYSATKGAQNAGLTVAGLINFDATTNWGGVNQVWATTNAAGCAAASGNATSNVVADPTGAQTLTLTAAAFNGGAAGTNNVYICLGVDGTTALTSRNITGSYDISVTGVGAVDPSAVTSTFQTWAPNGWQGYLPHMRYNASTKTYVRIVNANATAGILFADIRLADGTQVDRVQIGTLAANATGTYSAQDIATAAGVTDTNYAVLLTLTTDPDNVFANAYFNLLSAGVWTTRNVTLYEDVKAATSFNMK